MQIINHEQIGLYYDLINPTPPPEASPPAVFKLLAYKPKAAVRQINISSKEALIAVINSMSSGNYNFAMTPLATNNNEGFIVHIDIDDPNFDLSSLQPAPNMLVFTGRGHHAYWFLDRFIPYHNLVLRSKHLADVYGTDRTFDSTRVLRVPGTINQKSGKLARIVSVYDSQYTPSSFKEAMYVPTHTKVSISQLSEIDYTKLNRRISVLPTWLNVKLHDGYEQGEDRSRVDYNVVMNLAEYGFSCAEIAHIFSSDEYGISGKCMEAGERYLQMLLDKVVKRYPQCV